MSFSGRRLSILSPSNRRFSAGKELSLNGETGIVEFTLYSTNAGQNCAPKPIVNSVLPTKVTVPMPVSMPRVRPPASSGVQNARPNTAMPKTPPPGPT